MSELEPQLEVVKDDSLSINDLAGLQAKGFSVLRSAHVGNLSPYNLTIAQAGIPILAVDHMITGADLNYMPESMLSQAESTRVADIGRLVCRSQVTDLPVDVASLVGQPSYLDEAHFVLLQKLFPNTQFVTSTGYLRDNEAVVGEIISLAVTEFPEHFCRVTSPDGMPIRKLGAAALVASLGLMQLNDEPRAETEAVMMPNILDILANFVVEALKTDQAVQYHLSGAAMVQYIDELVPDLRAIYARLKKTASYGSKLPTNLTVRIIPSAEASFATTTDRGAKLDRMLGSVDELDHSSQSQSIKAKRKDFFASSASEDPVARDIFLEDVKAQETELELRVVEAMVDLPELFIKPGSPGFITQYDVLREGGLYVPAKNRELSMADLLRLSQRLKYLRKRYRII